ncbi:uncharacterized protein N7483_001352 [Penicillium malachiteum]|uniref:uncharacterized protein n=1 Tax=Penicillium malachiteum TaxID=1324776 RepID=UPI0025498DEB|nr:uncharacterized protein N7483_001352 [Penicillium malachiteum]KAJ5736227.1 hypothetical protein N7483_001352 [Penicillium malachiteum]
MIILVRHAQSEGNKNRDIHQTTPDHRVKLTAEGLRQAQEAGRRLRDLLRPDDTLHFFTSPYRRTRETTEGILESLTSDEPSPSPFPRNTIKVYEEPRLREQDFGNFQPCSTEMERMWMERADYGHFFYRIPNGESAADAYDRVSGFNESLWRLFGEDDFASVCVLVTHGLMTRVFLMKWYHWSVEYFEDLRNINHCEFVIMTHNPDNAKYTLQNKLRTWSDLRKQRDMEKKSELEAQGLSPTVIQPAEHVPIRRKWGGCPDGCTHGLSADAKSSLRSRIADTIRGNTDLQSNKSTPSKDTEQTFKFPQADTTKDTHGGSPNSVGDHSQSNPHPEAEAEEAEIYSRTGDASSDKRSDDTSRPIRPVRPTLQSFHRDSEDHLLHPPAVSSSTACLKLALLHLGGRDGGGSMSGTNSLAPSDDEDDHHHTRNTRPVSGQFHPRQLHRVSQDAGDDGDDELSAHPTEDLKRRPHHHYTHHHHHHHPHHHIPSNNYTTNHYRQTSSNASSQPPHHRMANILGDGDDLSTHSDSLESSHRDAESSLQNGNINSKPDEERQQSISLEEQQKQDQSIRGSVY